MVLSVALILFNKWLMRYGGFPLPLCLTSLHMGASSAIAAALRAAGFVEATLAPCKVLTLVVPTALLFAGSLCTGNEAMLHLSVSFVQMLKAWTPTVVLAFSIIAGLEAPSWRLLGIMLVMSGGVALAIRGELELAPFGLLMMLLSVVLEALRLVLVELLLACPDDRLSGLAGVYYTAPICFVAITPVAYAFEREQLAAAVRAGRVDARALLLNAVLAFLLNVSSLLLVKRTSALTLKARARPRCDARARPVPGVRRAHARARARWACAHRSPSRSSPRATGRGRAEGLARDHRLVSRLPLGRHGHAVGRLCRRVCRRPFVYSAQVDCEPPRQQCVGRWRREDKRGRGVGGRPAAARRAQQVIRRHALARQHAGQGRIGRPGWRRGRLASTACGARRMALERGAATALAYARRWSVSRCTAER